MLWFSVGKNTKSPGMPQKNNAMGDSRCQWSVDGGRVGFGFSEFCFVCNKS